jgi:NitT/TauT family transport system ATP-binding protein
VLSVQDQRVTQGLVSLRGVAKTFANGLSALAGFDLDVRPGEFLSLLGPSGCGKSTALRILAGLTDPTAGTVAWREAPEGDHRSEIGFVFQEPTLMPWATVMDNVGLPLRLRGLSRRDAQPRAEESLALVGLQDFAEAYPRELSGGMSMRVSIARALSMRPKLLLMDEPFAALDEITRFRLNDDLLRLHRDLGCTVVFVTHSVYESVYLSHRVAVMTPRPGRVAAILPVEPRQTRDMAFRSSAPYAGLCGEVSRALAQASSGAEGAS